MESKLLDSAFGKASSDSIVLEELWLFDGDAMVKITVRWSSYGADESYAQAVALTDEGRESSVVLRAFPSGWWVPGAENVEPLLRTVVKGLHDRMFSVLEAMV